MTFTENDAIDLSKYIGGARRLKNRIFRVGIELEGAWNTTILRERLSPNLYKTFRPTHDGSVRITAQEMGVTSSFEADKWYVGELPGPPLDPVKGSKLDFRAWMKEFYPHKVNKTCGMHVHMSFNSALTYQRLMVVSYPASVVKYCKTWATETKIPKEHCLWDRLAGNSVYCQHVFYPDEQVVPTRKDFNQTRKGHRYTVINFPFSINQTTECRLLPMFDDKEVAIAAIENLIEVTNAFLVATAKKEVEFQSEVVPEESTLNEQYHITV